MKTLPLSQGKLALVSDEDYEYFKKWKWSYAKAGRNKNLGYAVRTDRSQGRKETIMMHREVLARILGRQPELGVFHRNTNGLDNRRENLWVATASQRVHNSRFQKSHTSSRFVGVSLLPDGTWEARLRIHGRLMHIGRFDVEEEAAAAYDQADIRFYGEYARCNMVPPRTIPSPLKAQFEAA